MYGLMAADAESGCPPSRAEVRVGRAHHAQGLKNRIFLKPSEIG
jgi:hypothetical protein